MDIFVFSFDVNFWVVNKDFVFIYFKVFVNEKIENFIEKVYIKFVNVL